MHEGLHCVEPHELWGLRSAASQWFNAHDTSLQGSQNATLGAGLPPPYWLVIGIPTVPRMGNTDYLTRTLESLLAELTLDGSDPLFGEVLVIIQNNRPGNHSVFEQV